MLYRKGSVALIATRKICSERQQRQRQRESRREWMEERRTGGLKMRTVARPITEVCPHCSLTSKLSGVRPRVASGSPPSPMHPLLSITRQLPTRDSIISSWVLARPPACQPATSLVMSWSLSCPVLPPSVALGPVRPRTESHLAPSILRGDDTSTCTVRYSAVRTSCTRLVCLYASQPGPAQPSPLWFLPLHIPNYASPSKLCILASDHQSHHPGIRTA